MKKIYLSLLILFALSAIPAMAATAPAKAAWKPILPKGYSPITWAGAPGVASFYQAPADNGAIDYLTRIYLPQNQINFIASTNTPANLSNPIASSSQLLPSGLTASPADISNFPNLSFKRLGAEAAKTLDSSIKFLWDAPFFNMHFPYSDLSMGVKYTIGTTTIISSGSRSVPDMALARRMLVINNQKGTALIKDFDSTIFTDSKSGDQAIEGFSPAVAKSDSASGAASRLFLGVSADGKELVVYCSQAATVKEASDALVLAGVSIDHQLEADGGGSAACGYNMPGQYFVEPTRSLPLLMGARTILARGTVTTQTINVRKGPGTKYPIVVKLIKGASIQALEEKNGWYRIGAGEWILKTLIK
jgi:rhodanese-related sulfurtransferase